MPRLLLKFSLLITFMLTITSLTARVLGSTQPPNPALRGFTERCENKPQPCWYGIVPKVTTMKETQKWIEINGYSLNQSSDDILYFVRNLGANSPLYPSCTNIWLQFAEDKQTLASISLWGCESITLGTLSPLGLPKKMMVLQSTDSYLILGDYFTASIGLRELFSKSYDAKVFGLSIGHSAKGLYESINQYGHLWHGFVPHWRFCQLEPDYCQQ